MYKVNLIMYFGNQLSAEDVGSFLYFFRKNVKKYITDYYSEQAEKETV